MFSPSRAIVAGLAVLSCALVALGANETQLDCSRVEIMPLLIYAEDCGRPVGMNYTGSEGYMPNGRLATLERCSCQLLSHPLAWRSLVSHEVDTLFQVAKRLVEKTKPTESTSDKDDNPADKVSKRRRDRKNKKDLKDSTDSPSTGNEVSEDNALFKEDPQGRLYFWDKFNAMLAAKGAELSGTVVETFNQLYYNPKTFTTPFLSQKASEESSQLVAASCEQLLKQFKTPLSQFNALVTLADNPRYEFVLASHDDSLFKVFSVVHMCQQLGK